MNTYFLTMIIFFTGAAVVPLVAQQPAVHQQNYIVITKKVDQLKPLILSAEALKKEDGADFGKFEVVICGKDIGDITDPAKMDEHLRNAKAQGVDIIACGFSMRRFGVDTSQVPKGMRIVDNGILYNLRMQKKGYKSLGL